MPRLNFSASSRRSNRVTVVKGTRPNAFRATNRSKIGDTDPERSFFPDTYKMLLLLSALRAGPPETRKCHDLNFSASRRRSNRVTVVKGTRPNAFLEKNRSKIGDTDPESSLFPDTYKMLMPVGVRP